MKLLTFILALLLSAQSLEAPAEAYPSKPIRLVIPFAAGSATDAAGRVLAQALSQRLGQLSFGTASSASLVGAETIDAMTHTDLVAVGYKASPQAILDLFVPAGTPQPMVARLAHETLASLAQSDLRDRLAALGFEVNPLDTVAFGRYVREQLDTWRKLIRAATIQPE